MSIHFTVQQVEKFTVVEFMSPSLMDPIELDEIGRELVNLVEEQDKRLIVLDFTRVQYLSSMAIGIVLNMHKKMAQLKGSQLTLCGVGPKLMELLKITRLDRILRLKPSQREAVQQGPK